MRKFLLATIATVTLFALGVAAKTIAGTTPDVADIQVAQQRNCNNPQSQTEMNICAGIAYRNADQKLNRVYQQLVPKLSASRRQKLITAQQAWIKFRDTSCEFERSEAEGGSLAPTIYGGCLARVTEQRTRDLQNYLESTNR